MINTVSIVAYAVYSHHVTLILYCSCDQKLAPCNYSSFGPVGDIEQHIISRIFRPPAPYRKAEVEADKRKYFPSFQFNEQPALPNSIRLFFMCKPEKMTFVVMKKTSVRFHPDQPVVKFSVFRNDQAARDHAIFFRRSFAHPLH